MTIPIDIALFRDYPQGKEGGAHMLVIPLGELHRREIFFRILTAIDLVPVNREYIPPSTGRGRSCLMLIIEGNCEFEWMGEKTQVRAGGLVYLPESSHHIYRTTSETIRYIQINFNMLLEDGQTFNLSDHPLLLEDTLDEEGQMLCHQIQAAFFSDSLRMQSLMYHLFSRLSAGAREGSRDSIIHSRLSPALQKLEQTVTREVPTRELAALCSLSETHFRRLFRRYTGLSPTGYRNQMRVRLACRLLKDPASTVSEIAWQLGFESLYYFSRVFRAETGKSPSTWRKNCENE